MRSGAATASTRAASAMFGAGDAVADGELGPARRPRGRAAGASTSSQSAWAQAPVDWAMSPTTVIEPLSDRRVEHAQLHRREVLGLVDHDVAVGAHLVVVAAGRLRPRRRPEQGPGLVEQRHVVDGPRDVVDRRRPGAVQGGDAPRRQQVRPPAEREQAAGAEEVVEQLGRGEHRPHPLERLAHLGRCGAAGRGPRRRRAGRGSLSASASNSCCLDEAPAGVVVAEAAPGVGHDARGSAPRVTARVWRPSRHPQVAGAGRAGGRARPWPAPWPCAGRP